MYGKNKTKLWLPEIYCKNYGHNVSTITGWHIGACVFYNLYFIKLHKY